MLTTLNEHFQKRKIPRTFQQKGAKKITQYINNLKIRLLAKKETHLKKSLKRYTDVHIF